MLLAISKRFTNTVITGIPETAKLVLVVGPNGCGKSSLIDAAQYWHRANWAKSRYWQDDYHVKDMGTRVQPDSSNYVSVEFHNPQPTTDEQRAKAIYARSAYRNDPEFQLDHLARVDSALKEFRINRLIDNDQAVSLNYRRLVSKGFEDVYQLANDSLTLGEFREQAIGEIRDSLLRLIPGLVLNSLGNPLTDGTFRFSKGDSSAFHYKNLSGGEKAIFDLILDIIVKRREFNDTVFIIDEPEAHVATSLQGPLLRELERLVPDSSQLWLATHSIGMMRTARMMESQHPGSVAFLDFDNVDFDIAQTLHPTSSNRPFWNRAMRIALDDLAGYLAPEKVVLCEGDEFDAACYNEIFSYSHPNVLFVGTGNANDVKSDPRGIEKLFRALATDVEIIKMIDRDDSTDSEIESAKRDGIRVLSLRTIESYLLDNSVLTELCQSENHPEAIEQLLSARDEALENSAKNGGPRDDWKRAAGDIYNAAKRLIPSKMGSDKKRFMKEKCAPLVRTVPDLYTNLENDIFG